MGENTLRIHIYASNHIIGCVLLAISDQDPVSFYGPIPYHASEWRKTVALSHVPEISSHPLFLAHVSGSQTLIKSFLTVPPMCHLLLLWLH